MTDRTFYKRGQIFWYNEYISRDVFKYLSNCGYTLGQRPVIVYRNIDIMSSGVTIIPLSTGHVKNGVPLQIEEGTDSTALITEIRNVPITALKYYVGTVSDEKMSEIDNVICQYFGLASPIDYTYFPRAITFNSRLYAPRPTSDRYNAPIHNTTEETDEQQDVLNAQSDTEETVDIVERRPRENPYCQPRKESSFDIFEKAYLKLDTVQGIQNNYLCSRQTVTRRKVFGEKQFATAKDILECSELYARFKTIKLKNMTHMEQVVFKNLAPGRLSTVMNMSITEIIKYQSAITG